MNRLYVDPKEVPSELLARFPQATERKKPGPLYKNTDILVGALQNPSDIPTHIEGRVPNGLADSRGFITTETSNQSAYTKGLEEDTLDTWNRGRQELAEMDRRRREIMSAPLKSASPDSYISVSRRDHAPLLEACIRDDGTNQFHTAKPKGRHPVENPYVTASLRPQKLASTDHALIFQERDAAMKDINGLRNRLDIERQSGVHFARNGTSGYVDTHPKPSVHKTPGFLTTATSYQSYGDFDSQFYVNNDLYPDKSGSYDEENAVYHKRERTAVKNVGHFETEHASAFQDRSEQNEIDPSHRKAHYFERRHGTMCGKRGCDATLRPNNTQGLVSAADILPDSFTTTSMKMNAHFLRTT